MSYSIKKKKKAIKKIKKISNSAISLIISNPCGIKSNQINKLRKKARKKKVIINVVRNTLLKIGLKKTNFSKIRKNIIGPTLLAYSMKNPGSAAKILKRFSEKNKKFKIIAGIFEKKILNQKQIYQLASLPTYKEALTKLIYVLKEAAIGKLAKTIYLIGKKIDSK